MNLQDVRQIINDQGIIRVSPESHELITMDHKGFYKWQFVLSRAIFDPKVLNLIADQFWSQYQTLFESHPFQIGAIANAGTPIATAILLRAEQLGLDVNMIVIRKEVKNFGLRNRIEGHIQDLPVLLVDDLASPQHTAFWNAMHALREARLALYPFTFVIVLKQNSVKSKQINTLLGVTVIQSLFNLDDFGLKT